MRCQNPTTLFFFLDNHECYIYLGQQMYFGIKCKKKNIQNGKCV